MKSKSKSRPLPAEAAHLALKVFHQALAALGGSPMSQAQALRGLMAATLSSSATIMTREDIADWLQRIASELQLQEAEKSARAAQSTMIEGAFE